MEREIKLDGHGFTGVTVHVAADGQVSSVSASPEAFGAGSAIDWINSPAARRIVDEALLLGLIHDTDPNSHRFGCGCQLPDAQEIAARAWQELHRTLGRLAEGVPHRSHEADTGRRQTGPALVFLADADDLAADLRADISAPLKRGILPAWTALAMRGGAGSKHPMLARALKFAERGADSFRKRRTREAPVDPEAIATQALTPEERVLLAEALSDVLAVATPRQRVAMQRYAEGYSVSEAGVKAGLSADWTTNLRRKLR